LWNNKESVMRARCKSVVKTLVFAGILYCLFPVFSFVLVTPAYAGLKNMNVFSTPQELVVGEIFAMSVARSFPMLRDPYLDWYLNHRGRMLASVSKRADIPYSFSVINSSEINAFALPGGHIYINLGTFQAADNESELLGIVAHEISHVVAKHSVEQITQIELVNAGLSATYIYTNLPAQIPYIAANLFQLGFLKLSRDDEREADAMAYEMLVNAGVDPMGLVTMFEKLAKLHKKKPTALDKLFSTHPLTDERIKLMRQEYEAASPPPNLLVTSKEFEMIKERVNRLYRPLKEDEDEDEDNDLKKPAEQEDKASPQRAPEKVEPSSGDADEKPAETVGPVEPEGTPEPEKETPRPQ
jgi:predicted Zn-dependent protease